jgi:hypothetical protein
LYCYAAFLCKRFLHDFRRILNNAPIIERMLSSHKHSCHAILHKPTLYAVKWNAHSAGTDAFPDKRSYGGNWRKHGRSLGTGSLSKNRLAGAFAYVRSVICCFWFIYQKNCLYSCHVKIFKNIFEKK